MPRGRKETGPDRSRRRIVVPDGKHVTAITYEATGDEPARPAVLVLAHGAGADQEHAFMVDVARRLAQRGLRTVTFNFPYMEEGRKLPDRPALLEKAFGAVVDEEREAAAQACNVRLVFVGGKSLGGRMASHLAAQEHPGLVGLVCLGYPLHPPGKPEQLRTKHLPQIRVPVLIVQGACDPFGDPAQIRAHTKAVPAPVTVQIVEDGDHSFKVPKRTASADAVMRGVVDGIVRFVDGVCGGQVGQAKS